MVIIDAGKLPLEWENDDEVKDLMDFDVAHFTTNPFTPRQKGFEVI
jgi:hypothetical protein